LLAMSSSPLDDFLFDTPPKPDVPRHLDLDFHNTDECAQLMRLIGIISVDWNFCEVLFSHLIWHYVGGLEVGRLITPELGNQSRADVLLALARKHEKSKRYLECVEFAALVFNRMREWRNKLVHSHSIMPATANGKMLIFLRMATKGPNALEMRLKFEEIVRIYDCVAYLGLYLARLHTFNFARSNGKREKLPGRFPLPDIPIRPRPVARKGGAHLKKSSLPSELAPKKPPRFVKLSSAQKRKAREDAGGQP
jgi:hypothetical protein